MPRIFSFLAISALMATSTAAIAQAKARLGIDDLGNAWFIAPSGNSVVFGANGGVYYNGSVIATCTGKDTVTSINGITVVCEEDEVTLSAATVGAEVYSRDAEDLSLITPTLVLTKEIGEMSPAAIPQTDTAIVIETNPATTETADTSPSSSVAVTVEGDTTAVQFTECGINPGTYNYVFSDGTEAYYYDGTTTIRVDSDGSRIIVDGDFEVTAFGNTYSRRGDTFGYRNFAGTYEMTAGGEILYSPDPAFAATAALAPIGFTYSDDYGTYRKAAGGQIVFVPHNQQDDLVVTKEDCGGNQCRIVDGLEGQIGRD